MIKTEKSVIFSEKILVSQEIKPDFADAQRRWEAYWQGDIIDRPIVCITVPKKDYPAIPESTYYDRVHGDIDTILDNVLHNTQGYYWLGDSVPSFYISFAPDEIAAYCGGKLVWNNESGDTVWVEPIIKDWDEYFPLEIKDNNPLWIRMLDFYRKAADKFKGKMFIAPLDFHTNMDLLAALRSPQQLLLDLVIIPEKIDRVMLSSRTIFGKLWPAMVKAGKFDESGYGFVAYSPKGLAYLQCDLICMISPAHFRRWVFPALEEEASIVKNVLFHWDGPGALVHREDIIHAKFLHTLDFVPSPGIKQFQYLELYKKAQVAGRAVILNGSPDQLKQAHKELKPNLVQYRTRVETIEEGEQLLAWFVQNT